MNNYDAVIEHSLDTISGYYKIDRRAAMPADIVYEDQPRNMIIRMKFSSKDINPEGIIAKVSKNPSREIGMFEKEAKNLFDLNKKFTSSADLGVPKFVGYIPEDRTILTETVKGNSLYNIVVNSTVPIINIFTKGKVDHIAELAAKWLNIAHDRMETDANAVFKEKTRLCMEKMDILRTNAPELFNSEICETVLKAMEKCRELSSDPVMVWSHKDYSLTNMIYKNGKLYVLDVAHAAPDLMYTDIIRFWQLLENMKNAYTARRGVFQSMQDIFLSSYKEKIDMTSPEAIFCRIKDGVTNLLSYDIPMRKGLYYGKELYKLYFKPQYRSLKDLLDSSVLK
jgi:hypothetical protein